MLEPLRRKYMISKINDIEERNDRKIIIDNLTKKKICLVMMLVTLESRIIN